MDNYLQVPIFSHLSSFWWRQPLQRLGSRRSPKVILLLSLRGSLLQQQFSFFLSLLVVVYFYFLSSSDLCNYTAYNGFPSIYLSIYLSIFRLRNLTKSLIRYFRCVASTQAANLYPFSVFSKYTYSCTVNNQRHLGNYHWFICKFG